MPESKDESVYSTKYIIPPLPATKQGFGMQFHAQAHRRGNRFVYSRGRYAFVRDLDDVANNKVYSEHKQEVTCSRISKSGVYVATGDVTGQVNVWELSNLRTKSEVPTCTGVYDVAWDADSKRIAAVGSGSGTFGKPFLMDSGNSVGKIERHAKTVLSVDYRQTRPYRLITASEDLDVIHHTGPPFKFGSKTKGFNRYPSTCRFSPDGATSIVVSQCGKIVQMDGKTGETIKSLESKDDGHKGALYSFAWSPDSKKILTASADKTAKIWNVEEGTVETTFTVAENPERSDMQQMAAWAGDHILSVSLSGAINFWNPEEPSAPSKVIQGLTSGVTSFNVDHKNGFVYATDSNGRVNQFNVENGDVKWATGTGPKNITSGSLSSNGTTFYATSLAGSLHTVAIDYEAGTCEWTSGTTDLGGVAYTVACANSGDDVAVAGLRNHKRLVVVAEGAVVHTEQLDYQPQEIVFRPDDGLVAVAGNKHNIYTYQFDGKTLTFDKKLEGHRSKILDLSYSPDGKWLVSVAQGKNIYFWDENGDQCNVGGWSYHNGGVTSVNWNPSGTSLVTCSADCSFIVFDSKSTEAFNRPPTRDQKKFAHQCGINYCAFVDDETVVTLGDDLAFKVWNKKADDA